MNYLVAAAFNPSKHTIWQVRGIIDIEEGEKKKGKSREPTTDSAVGFDFGFLGHHWMYPCISIFPVFRVAVKFSSLPGITKMADTGCT